MQCIVVLEWSHQQCWAVELNRVAEMCRSMSRMMIVVGALASQFNQARLAQLFSEKND